MNAVVEIRSGNGEVLYQAARLLADTSIVVDIPPTEGWHKVVVSLEGPPPPDLTDRVAELEAQLEAVRALVCECALPEEDDR